MESSLKEKSQLLKLLRLSGEVDREDKVIHLVNELYGFIDTSGKIKLVNLQTDKVLDNYYNIEYIYDDKILLNAFDVITYYSKLITRDSFEIIIEDEAIYHKVSNLIYTEVKAFSLDETITKLYNLSGELVAEIPIRFEVSLVNIENTDLYLLTTFGENDDSEDEASQQSLNSDRVICIYYNSDTKEFIQIFNIDKCVIENITDDLYKISSRKDFTQIYIVDMTKLNKNPRQINLEDYSGIVD